MIVSRRMLLFLPKIHSMHKVRHYYLIRLQFLGFRYSGWQKQPGQRTIEGMLSKTIKFVLPDTTFKILGAGRTDSKVSALDAVFELFLENEPLPELDSFLNIFNKNLPPDIRITEIVPTDANFNIIQHAKSKEYIYLFSFGEKNHPFCAPFVTGILEELNMDLVKEAAALFEGEHDFTAYTAQLKPGTKVVRTIDTCEVVPNSLLTANFFPKESYMLVVKGNGFMRYQIRMIMGALFQVGKGDLSLDQIKDSFDPTKGIVLNSIAPGSGLILNEVNFAQN